MTTLSLWACMHDGTWQRLQGFTCDALFLVLSQQYLRVAVLKCIYCTTCTNTCGADKFLFPHNVNPPPPPPDTFQFGKFHQSRLPENKLFWNFVHTLPLLLYWFEDNLLFHRTVCLSTMILGHLLFISQKPTYFAAYMIFYQQALKIQTSAIRLWC